MAQRLTIMMPSMFFDDISVPAVTELFNENVAIERRLMEMVSTLPARAKRRPGHYMLCFIVRLVL